ncbi:MAG: type II toxin-antitoxin system VapC family toxin, partial [bacterium]
HQQITHEWWDKALPLYEHYISPVVLEEISRGEPKAAESRLQKVKSFSLLEVVPEVNELANLYYSELDIPEKAVADAFHLALATWHGMDFLISWNCKHIVNGRVKLGLEEINTTRGHRTPLICTPEELMEV